MSWTVIQSRSIHAVRFFAEQHALDVWFRTGHIYRYAGLSSKTYAGLLGAPSKGRFFVARIRGRYPSVRIR